MTSDAYREYDKWIRGSLLGSILAGVIFISFSSGLHGDFIFDDYDAIVNNTSIQTGDLQKIFNPPRNLPVSGRPLLNLSFAITYYFSQDNPTAYHWTNLILQITNALLLWWVIRVTLLIVLLNPRNKPPSPAMVTWLAMMLSLMWAIHPVQTEVVLYATQRSEQLVFLSLLLALVGLIRQARSPGRSGRLGWLGMSLLACAAGIECKELVVIYPLILLLYDRTFLSGSFAKAFKQHKGYYLTLSGIVGLLAGWKLSHDPWSNSTGFGHNVTSLQYLMTQSQVILWYLKLGVLPTGLCLKYGWPIATHFSQVWVSFSVMGLLFAGACYSVWRFPKTGFCLISVFLILGPTSSFWPLITEVAADRRVSIPLAFLLPLGGVAMWFLFAKRCRMTPGKTGILTISLLLIVNLLLATLTLRQAVLYDQPILLWQNSLKTTFQRSAIMNELSVAYDNANAWAPAWQVLSDAIELAPEFGKLYLNLGFVEMHLGRWDRAIEQFQKIEKFPQFKFDAARSLGLIYKQQKRYARAIHYFSKAWHESPTNGGILLNLARCYVLAGQNANARRAFEKLVQQYPDDWQSRYELGRVYAKLNQLALAQQQYQIVLNAWPNNAKIWNSLGVVFARQHQMPNAIACFRKALSFDPDNQDALANLKKATSH